MIRTIVYGDSQIVGLRLFAITGEVLLSHGNTCPRKLLGAGISDIVLARTRLSLCAPMPSLLCLAYWPIVLSGPSSTHV